MVFKRKPLPGNPRWSSLARSHRRDARPCVSTISLTCISILINLCVSTFIIPYISYSLYRSSLHSLYRVFVHSSNNSSQNRSNWIGYFRINFNLRESIIIKAFVLRRLPFFNFQFLCSSHISPATDPAPKSHAKCSLLQHIRVIPLAVSPAG